MKDKKHPKGRNEVEESMDEKKLGGAKKDIVGVIELKLSFLGGTRFFYGQRLAFWPERRDNGKRRAERKAIALTMSLLMDRPSLEATKRRTSTTAASVQEAAAGGEPASSGEAEGDKGYRTTNDVSQGRSSRPDLHHQRHALRQGRPSRPDSPPELV